MSEKENTKNYDFPVGKIVGAHGVKGQIKIRPSSNNPGIYLKLKSVLLEDEKKSERGTQTIKSIEFDRKMFFVKFAECNSRNDAEKLIGLSVYTQKSQLAKLGEDEWWVNDLLGLSVFAKSGEKLGTISNVFGDRGEWIEVSLLAPEGKAVLIPFVKELVPVVDMADKRVEINTEVQGLLD